MVEKQAIIRSKYGIHARPAGAIRNAAIKFTETKIVLIDPKDNKEYNAKEVLSTLVMTNVCGDTLLVRAYGIDEDSAAEAVAKVIREYEIEE